MATFTEQVWERAAALRRQIIDLPFNQALLAGTLPQDKFQFYMLQDSLYLEGYSRVLSLASARAPDTDMMLEFSQAAQVALVVERSLHEGFFEQFNVPQTVINAAEPSPTCLNYVNFLLTTGHSASHEETVAAILPCFWVYWEVGQYIHARAADDNPYRAWIDTYAGDDFADSVKRQIAITDQLAADASPARQEAMARAFMRCTQFEWMFWDSAYRQESWPV
ncbi:MAG: thiaminase II [Alphaproteobacteria bacterium]